MNILIFHRVSFKKARYDYWIDHTRNNVTYIGSTKALKDIPTNLRCERHSKSCEDSILDHALENNINRVVALSEYDLEKAGRLRDKLGLRILGLGLEDAIRSRDKIVMKQHVSKAGIKVPQNFRLTDIDKYRHECWLGKSVVLKPVSGASSEGVQIFQNGISAMNLRMIEPEGFEIEEFISGPIFHIDGWVYASELQDFVLSQYTGTCFEYAQGNPLGSFQISMNELTLKKWIQSILTSLKIEGGAFHLECIGSKEGFVFLEIGHRVGGAAVAETFQHKTGIDLYGKHLEFQLGYVEPSNKFISNINWFSWFVFPAHHLTSPFCKISNVEETMLESELVCIDVAKYDEPIKGWPKLSYNRGETALAGIIKSENSLTLINDLKTMFQKIQINAIDFPCLKIVA